MSHNDVPEFLQDALKFGINLGLERMNELDRLIGDPQKDLKVVHVAGTNGKGSVVTFLSSCLAESGLKVGIYTSPFLERFSERMRIIDGREGLDRLLKDDTEGEINEEDLNRLSRRVEEACGEMVRNGFEHPTEFELVTAVCYLWFKEQKVDVAVLETGLGGRLDSTNVFDDPLVTVITSIGLDHQDRLGDTIDKIAKEKAGIFKKGAPAYVSDPDMMILPPDLKVQVRSALDEAASEKDVSINYVDALEDCVRFTDDGKMAFEAFGKEYVTRLLGRHQVLNATLAIRVLKDVFELDEDVIGEGISKARWKGRAELLSLDPPVILDGGHNVQCAQSLVSTLKDMCGGRFRDLKFRVVIGVMSDKNVEGMIKTLYDAGLDPVEVYAVRVDNARSMDPEGLSNIIYFVYNNSIRPMAYENALEGVTKACEKTAEDGIPLLVTGSLYLIGEVRGKLCTITDNWL
ncbi:MAG: bifunctional folylpolyglutamate synthase/dihydrofolate synthase [Clostridiales bacterium]|nr:bifunctional folylpolyglutamate synthase/dihydrofolate synthase [Clostridiales bacterium]